ncbi:3-oxoacyl-ACP reductase, partial [Mesorhizobium sp. M7A.F.Ca.CA.004.06.1.1]
DDGVFDCLGHEWSSFDVRESRADTQAYDAKARQRLRALSLDLIGTASPTSKEDHS